ncbi:ATP-binding protein [Niabella ginsengisoli]|uniref:ATP-binding protein n=1 Tax=Niabella ginsengisoli TaxID=522298 RepID=UPI00293F1884|nr:ATP-binding protein [Niabella ginsengisoli]
MESGSRRGTASEKGTGLGLMLCKEFTGIMEGRLTFLSARNNGTTFSLVLPATSLVRAIPQENYLEVGKLQF